MTADEATRIFAHRPQRGRHRIARECSAQHRHPPRSWFVLSLPTRGSYADHIHLWGGRRRGRSERVRDDPEPGVASRAACQ